MENKRVQPEPKRRPPVQQTRHYPPPRSTVNPPARPGTQMPPPRARGAQAAPYRTPGTQTAPSRKPGTQTIPSRAQAAPSRKPGTQTVPPRKPAAQTALSRKPGPQEPPPEPRFRDALWSKQRETPAQNRITFLCALLYALIHLVTGFLLIRPLNLLTARMPFLIAYVVRAVLPALTGALLSALPLFPLRQEFRTMLLAYRKLLRWVLILLVGVLLLMWGEWEALKQVARFVLLFVSGPLIIGTALSVLLFYLEWLGEPDEEE